MSDFRKTDEEITTGALVALRNKKDKSLLNNKNVDCYVLGYKQAQSDFWEWLKQYTDEDNRTRLNKLHKFCEDKIKSIEHDLAMSGYMFTIPVSDDAMLKLLAKMSQSIAFVLEHLEDIKLTSKEYVKTL